MKIQRPILLILKVPPPYGGGEVINSFLSDGLSNDPQFYIFKIRSEKKSRTTQGKFAIWKIKEFAFFIATLIKHLITIKPRLIYMRFGKDHDTFIRDSIVLWISKIFDIGIATELAGERFWILDQSYPMKWYTLKVLSRMKSIRMLGERIAEKHIQDGITNSIVMDNGCYVPKNLYKKYNKEKILTFIFVGAHSQLNGFDILISAACKLKDNGFNFKLISIGDWESEEFQKKIYEITKEHSSSDWFYPLGLCVDNAKWSAYDKAHILVLPSLSEGQPMCILEALGVGLPGIATLVGGVPDIIKQGYNGLLIPPNDVNALFHSMKKLILSKELRNTMSQNNYTLFLERFTISSYIQNTKQWLVRVAEETN